MDDTHGEGGEEESTGTEWTEWPVYGSEVSRASVRRGRRWRRKEDDQREAEHEDGTLFMAGYFCLGTTMNTI